MRGDLSETSAADACRRLAGESATGVLVVLGADGDGRIVFDEGRVVAARSPIPGARLGDRLVGAGYLDDTQLTTALEEQAAAPGGTRLGALLVDSGAVPHDAIRIFVQEQILDALFELLRWRFGTFAFTAGAADSVTEVPIALSVDELLVEVSRRQSEWTELSTVIPDLEAIPSFRAGATSAAASLEPDEFAVLASIDGGRSVRTLAADLGYGEFELARIVYGLTLLGIVEIALPEDEIGAALDDAFSGGFGVEPATEAAPDEPAPREPAADEQVARAPRWVEPPPSGPRSAPPADPVHEPAGSDAATPTVADEQADAPADEPGGEPTDEPADRDLPTPWVAAAPTDEPADDDPTTPWVAAAPTDRSGSHDAPAVHGGGLDPDRESSPDHGTAPDPDRESEPAADAGSRPDDDREAAPDRGRDAGDEPWAVTASAPAPTPPTSAPRTPSSGWVDPPPAVPRDGQGVTVEADLPAPRDVFAELRELEATRPATSASTPEPEQESDETAPHEPEADAAAATDGAAPPAHPDGSSNSADVSEFLRELSRLALEDEPEPHHRPPSRPAKPSDGSGDDATRKRRGLFGWGG